MPPTITFVAEHGQTEQPSPLPDTCVLIGRKKDIIDRARDDGFLASLIGEAPSNVNQRLICRVLESVTVDAFSGGSGTTVVTTESGRFVRITGLITPDICSRHNCPVRPDAVSRLWKSNCGSFKQNLSDANDDENHPAKKARVEFKPSTVRVVGVLPTLSESSKDDAACYALAIGAALARTAAAYTKKAGRSQTPDSFHAYVSFVGDSLAVNSPAFSKVLEKIQLAANAIQNACSLVDQPANELTTTEFAKIAKEQADQTAGVTCRIIERDELQERGFGGLFGVGQAAVEPPRMVILNYPGSGANTSAKKTICWVGKGIVYDTGGLSIKTKTGMPGMKRDMGGAAAIMEAFFAAARAQTEHNLTAILCLAENAVGPLATRPDDIHTLYSGKTVEINNTDAEGRLVLSDGVALASKEIKPDILVNMCTLTGAQGVATGKYFAAIMSNSAELESKTIHRGRLCGDMCHPVPYCPEIFTEEFASKVADMKNSVANRGNAQVSCAGQFIGNNIDPQFNGQWLHVDMAAPASFGERATGYGVALLLNTFIY